MRTVVMGDVHGCNVELQAPIDRFTPSANTQAARRAGASACHTGVGRVEGAGDDGLTRVVA
jgi:hypothetical protein